jgi:Tol biopolymer transport system component
MKYIMIYLLLVALSIFLIYDDLQAVEGFPVLKGPYLGQKTPGITPEIFAPGILNNKKMGAFCSVFSADGNEFYFVYYKNEDESRGGIALMRRVNNIWTKPAMLHFNSTSIDGDMCLSVNGDMLIFRSYRPLPKVKEVKDYSYLWCVERTGQGWSRAKPLLCGGKPVRTGYPSISRDRTLYFSHRRNSRSGIYRSRLIKGKYSIPEYVTTLFNQNFIHGDLFVAPDGSYIVVSGKDRNGKMGYGQLDLYVIFLKSGMAWSDPINMGGSVNTLYGENCPQVSPEGKYFFFNRYNPNLKKGNIYWVSARVIEDLRPRKNQIKEVLNEF